MPTLVIKFDHARVLAIMIHDCWELGVVIVTDRARARARARAHGKFSAHFEGV